MQPQPLRASDIVNKFSKIKAYFCFFALMMRPSTMKLVALIRSQREIVHEQNTLGSILLASSNERTPGVSSVLQKYQRGAGES